MIGSAGQQIFKRPLNISSPTMLQHVTKTSMVKIQSWATTTEPDSEPGLVVDSINMENSPLIPGTLLVGPAQHKPMQMGL